MRDIAGQCALSGFKIARPEPRYDGYATLPSNGPRKSLSDFGNFLAMNHAEFLCVAIFAIFRSPPFDCC